MLTNLIASIFFTITTNDWKTHAVTTPYVAPANITQTVYRPPIAHQSSPILSNTVAAIVWNGKTNNVVIDWTVIGTAYRDVDAFQERAW